MVKVELQPHTGKSTRRGKPVTVTLPQQRVFVDGDFVGYVGDKAGSPFCSTLRPSEISEEELEAINEAVKQHHGGVAPPPAPSLPEDTRPQAEIDADDTVTIEDEA